MSSALGDWNVNSSFLTVTRVKVWEKALLLLQLDWDESGSQGQVLQSVNSQTVILVGMQMHLSHLTSLTDRQMTVSVQDWFVGNDAGEYLYVCWYPPNVPVTAGEEELWNATNNKQQMFSIYHQTQRDLR